MNDSREHYVLLGDDDREQTVVITLTDEGIVADVFDNGEPVATYAIDAQTLAERAF